MKLNIRVLFSCLLVSLSTFAQSWQSVEVSTDSIETQRQWMAQWLPLKWYPIKSPAQALLDTVQVKEGEHVGAGQTLMTLSQPELHLKLEEARWVVEQKKLHLKEIKDWTQSSEYRRANNDWKLSQQECERQEKKIQETLSLFELGGVAEDVLRQEESQWARCQIAEQQAQDRFETVKRRGDAQALLKSKLELKKALLNYRQCLNKVLALKVKAPVSGVFYSSHVFSSTQEPVQLLPYQEVQEKQWLGVLVPPEALGAVLEVSEKQLDELEQATMLELDVAGEKVPAQLISQEPLNVMKLDDNRFMKYQLKLKPEVGLARNPRLGCHVAVVASFKASTKPLSVPLKALHWHEGKPYVYKQEPNAWQPTDVQVIAIMNDKAHIEGHLKEGDRVGIAPQVS